MRGLGTRLETVSSRLEQQQRLLSQAEERHTSTRRRLAAALVLLAAIAAANLYTALSAARCKLWLFLDVGTWRGGDDLDMAWI